MAEIKINYKGERKITITGNYYPTESFIGNKSHIKFNDPTNELRNLLLTSPCGNINVDKIKILSLPDKGRLFYVTNPGVIPNTFANLYINQIISVSDLLNNNILRFNAEGSVDDQYTVSYLTSFTFERYCDLISTNIITTVELNMISATREFEVIDPKDLLTYLISNGTTDRAYNGFDYCPILNFFNNSYVYRNGRPDFDIQAGDRVFSNPNAMVFFNGGLKYYKMQFTFQPVGATSYIAKIDNNGFVVSVFGTCD